jgi:hypothetical protein
VKPGGITGIGKNLMRDSENDIFSDIAVDLWLQIVINTIHRPPRMQITEQLVLDTMAENEEMERSSE